MRGFLMFKKVKKYRVSLFLLALVAMLSVYYVMTPGDTGPSAPVDSITGDERYQEFAEMRLRIIDERNEQVALYETKIIEASTQSVVEEYMLEIDAITTLTEKEVSVEEIIMHEGYEDVLVYYSDGYIYVSIITDEMDATVFYDVAVAAKGVFGNNTKVQVKAYDAIS
jgi:hypothetical protein